MSRPETKDFVYVRAGAALKALVENISSAARVAVDTEADSLHNYFEKVCLIQLSFGGAHYIVDPLTGLDLHGFSSALAEKPLIFHGADYDLRMLRGATGFRARGEVFDTMIAAQLLGIEQIGLAALIEKFFAVKIAKEGQKSDWSRRPLSEQQMSYAVNDTRYLEAVADCLADELNARGRSEWHRESCRAMVAASERDRERDPDDAWRIKGAGRLTRPQLAYLRELWHWRDQLARHANRPAFMILGNQQILEVIAWADSHPGEPIEQGPKLPRNIRDSLLMTLGQAIKRAGEMSAAQWPELRRREHVEPMSAECVEHAHKLRVECTAIAAELGIAASTLAPKAALEAIARSRPRSIDEIIKCGGLLHWQAQLIHGAVEKCLG